MYIRGFMINRLPAIVAASIVILGGIALPASAQEAMASTSEATIRYLSPDELFAAASPSVVMVEVCDEKMKPTGLGSGFFVSSDGLLVTNFHVINRAAFAVIRRSDGSACVVEGVAATDEKADLALLKVSVTNAPALKLGDDTPPKIGTRVFAIGNPEGMTNTLSEGLISGLHANDSGLPGIQTSAAISHGSSGGPLMAADGTVVGVTSGFLANGQNLNFAIGAAQVRSMINGRGALKPFASAAVSKMDPTDSRAFAEVLAAINTRQTNQAIKLLNNLRERQGDNAMFWFTSGCLNHQLGNLDVAIDAFREAVRLKPDMFLAHAMLGDELFATKKYNEALVAYKAAAKIKPTEAGIYSSAGNVFSAQGNWADALKFYDHALKLDREDASTFRNRGRALAMLDRKEEAMDCFNAATKIEPHSVANYLFKADAHLRFKEVDEAGRMYRYVIAQEPNNAMAYFGLGCVDVVQKDLTGARTAWNNAARFDPKGPIGAVARDALKGLNAQGGVASGQ